MTPSEAPPKRKPSPWAWSGTTVTCDFTAGSLHQLDAPASESMPPPLKRTRHGWQVKVDNMTNIFNEYKHRVAECFDEGRSQGVVECNKLVDQLHEAMQHAPIVDQRLSVAGEKHRILTRAFAMREVLLIQDPTLAHLFAQEGILQPEEVKEKPKCHITMSRSSNEATPDATPSQCVLSVCLLLAALYEQTPWGEGSDLRRQVYHDFTILKRDFRKDQLMCLKGRTGTTEELFNAVKEVDRTQGLDNILGVLFDDWKVYSNRVDPFILADIDVQVLTLTADGPIGKFMCKLRTLMTLSLLHQRLLKELYYAAFANRPAPIKQYDMMTSSDDLDFYDWTEAMARNMPHKHVDGTTLYYAWMYSPEVHASPEQWEKIFGKGKNTLPTLFDRVTTPDGAVRDTDGTGDYSLDIEAACNHDFRAEGSAQAAVGFPWSDDLIGAYLRKRRAEGADVRRQRRLEKQRLRAEKEKGGKAGVKGPARPGEGVPAPGDPEGPLQGPGDVVMQDVSDSDSPRSGGRQVVILELSGQASWTIDARQGTPWAAPAGQEPQRAPRQPQEPEEPPGPEPIPDADETGQLALPLGIFLVGMICSGAFTNTQIHVEDLLLMSININIFGAPKVWWWLPKDKVQGFKAAAELMTEGGRGELYTKSISPFLTDKEFGFPEHILPLDRLRDLGARRLIQLPGMGIWTMPGYAFHFTCSMGLNVAESANMFLEVMGWTFEKLWRTRPVEQYPEAEDDMSRYMRETGILEALGVEDRLPKHAVEVHRELAPQLVDGVVKEPSGQRLKRSVYSQVVKYRVLPPASTHRTPLTSPSPVSTEQTISNSETASDIPTSGSDASGTARHRTGRKVAPEATLKALSAGMKGLTHVQAHPVTARPKTTPQAMVTSLPAPAVGMVS